MASKDPSKKAAPKGKADKDPKPVGSAKKSNVGVTSGVGVSATWIRVFEQNEKGDEKDRLTDEQISQFMKSEFPGIDAVTFDRVAIARGKYNRGGFHKKDAKGKVVRPKIHSRPQGADGDSDVSSRHGSTPDAAPTKDRVGSHQKNFKSHKK